MQLNHTAWEFIPWGADGIDWRDIPLDTYRASPTDPDALPRLVGGDGPVVYSLRTITRDELGTATRAAYDSARPIAWTGEGEDVRPLRSRFEDWLELEYVLAWWVCKFAVTSRNDRPVARERKRGRQVLTDAEVDAIGEMARKLIADEVCRVSTLDDAQKKSSLSSSPSGTVTTSPPAEKSAPGRPPA